MAADVSRTELEAMTRDELVDVVLELREQLEEEKDLRSKGLLEAAQGRKDLSERVEALETAADQDAILDRLDEIEAKAEQALTVASAGTASDDESKVDHAKRLTRNEIVRRLAIGAPSNKVPVTVAKVKEMARPERTLHYQTVKDAWDDLRSEWPCFRQTTKDGAKALTTARSDVSKALVRAVEVDLERDDLAKRLISENGEGGVSE